MTYAESWDDRTLSIVSKKRCVVGINSEEPWNGKEEKITKKGCNHRKRIYARKGDTLRRIS